MVGSPQGHSRLFALRRGIAGLRRRRALVRAGSAWSAILTRLLWIVVVAFVADWTFEMSRAQRAVLFALCALAAIRAVRRVLRERRGTRETDLDVALMVERQRGIDSDIVAALQFESPEAPRWGSAELETAVVERVAELSRGIDVYEGFSAREISRRAGILAASAALVLGAAAIFPEHASVFLKRCLMSSAHYPTDTIIAEIRVNGRPVTETDPRAPFGKPLRFEVVARGEIPGRGHVELAAREGDLTTRVELERSADAAPRFTGELPRLLGDLDFQVYLGDAWTEPRAIRVIPLPAIRLELRATPPAYAAGAMPEDRGESREGARQLSVLEGSHVEIGVTCENKRLERVTAMMLGDTFELEPRGDVWRLPGDGTPLTRVAQTLRFEIAVEDEDGLGLESPAHGVVRIRADRQPRASAAMVTEHVLPTARPTIRYGVADDHGIAEVSIRHEIKRANGRVETIVETILEGADGERPRVVRESHELDLTPLRLVKGDRVTVTIEAVDHRGDAEGQSVASEPVVLHVTDERGVLAAMVETDQRSARQLDAIIERQLGIGR